MGLWKSYGCVGVLFSVHAMQELGPTLQVQIFRPSHFPRQTQWGEQVGSYTVSLVDPSTLILMLTNPHSQEGSLGM